MALRRQPGRVRFGAWWMDPGLSTQKAGLYHRARAARHVPYALPLSEAMYFAAYTDSGGQPLRSGGSYSIHGTDPDTRWWSIAAYQNDQLIPNAAERYSYSSSTVRRRPDGSWHIRFSPGEHPGNWLPNTNSPGEVKLVFRCYGPGTVLTGNPGAAPLPSITAGVSQ
jgi:hypothetical protein